jgi:pyrimidine deaminase RibD-like protein
MQSTHTSVIAEEISDKDRCYMLQALELAKRALGKTEPNPAVGCVIVKDDQVKMPPCNLPRNTSSALCPCC